MRFPERALAADQRRKHPYWCPSLQVGLTLCDLTLPLLRQCVDKMTHRIHCGCPFRYRIFIFIIRTWNAVLYIFLYAIRIKSRWMLHKIMDLLSSDYLVLNTIQCPE